MAKLTRRSRFTKIRKEPNLKGAGLGGAILLYTNLDDAKNLTPQQLTGKDAPLLCNVRFPDYITGINPNRDCDRIPEELVNRGLYSDLQSAQKHVMSCVNISSNSPQQPIDITKSEAVSVIQPHICPLSDYSAITCCNGSIAI